MSIKEYKSIIDEIYVQFIGVKSVKLVETDIMPFNEWYARRDSNP